MRSDEIAADVGTNPAVIRALLSRLSAAGLTSSLRGNGGGAMLAREASQIRLLDVYLAVEDREIFSFHSTSPDDGEAIGRDVATSLAKPLLQARLAMEHHLAAVSIQCIIDDMESDRG